MLYLNRLEMTKPFFPILLLVALVVRKTQVIKPDWNNEADRK